MSLKDSTARLIIGVETSCDETAVALYHLDQGLLAEELHSQIEAHKEYGGVVPELAARDHIVYALPLLNKLLSNNNFTVKDIAGVAYTKGPGLVGGLLVGAALARSFAWALSVPAIGVHHMEAHLAAMMLEPEPPCYPYLGLLISGGHTMLLHVHELGRYTILGQTLDDAVGEAFDKAAKQLGLDYPGGPAIAKLAEQGDPNFLKLPRPMCNRPGLDFSFSGLKTALMQQVKSDSYDAVNNANLARAFEEAAVDTIAIKVERALQQTGLNSLVMAGGVSANKRLRQTLSSRLEKIGAEVFYPRPEYCTDNAAMVACLGAARLEAGDREDLAIKVHPRWSMEDLTVPGSSTC